MYEYVLIGHRAIFNVSLIPDNGRFRILVSWENERAAMQGFKKRYCSRDTYSVIDQKAILEACDYGFGITKAKYVELLLQTQTQTAGEDAAN